MAGQGTVTIKILGDSSSALRAMGQTEAGLAGLGDKFGKFASAGVLAGTAVAGGVAAAGVGLFKIGESFDEAYDKIRVGTGKTGAELSNLEQSFKNVVSAVPADFGKAGDAITLVSQKLGATGPALETISEQFLELSRITNTDLAGNLQAGTDALNQWGVAIEEQPAKLDELFRASQVSGVSFADLANRMTGAGVQLQALGFSFDQATTVIAGLGKAGIDVSDVMPALSKTMAVAAKDGKSAQDVYQGLVQAIKGAPDDITAAQIAFDTLGAKAGPRFAALIREGKFSFDKLGESIAEGQDTIIGAGRDTQDFAEKWELFKNRVLVALEPLAIAVFDGVGKAMDKLGPIITELSEAFGKDGLSGVFEVLKAKFDDLEPKFKVAIAVAGALAVAIVGIVSPVLLVVAGLAALVAGVIYAYQHFEAFAEIVDGVVGVITTLWDNFGDNILEAAERVWIPIQNIIAGAMQFIQGIVEVVLAILHGDFEGAWQGIVDVVEGALQQLLGIVQLAFEAIRLLVGVVLEVIGSLFKSGWQAIVNVVSTALATLVQFFIDLPGRILGALASLPGLLVDLGVRLIGGLWDGITAEFGNVLGWFAGLPGQILSAIGDLNRILYDAGRRVIQGFIDGIKSMVGSVKDTLGDIAGSLTSWKGPPAKDAVVLVGAGQLVMQGFMSGIESQIPPLRDKLGNVAKLADISVRSAVASSVVATQAKPTVLVGAAGGNTYNVTVNAGMGANGAAIGDAVVIAIKQYEQRNGAGWRN